jgi:hypothetical protein
MYESALNMNNACHDLLERVWRYVYIDVTRLHVRLEYAVLASLLVCCLEYDTSTIDHTTFEALNVHHRTILNMNLLDTCTYITHVL